MKKRMFVYILIFAVCFSQLAAVPVFGEDITFMTTNLKTGRFMVLAKVNNPAINGISATVDVVTPASGTWPDLSNLFYNGTGTLDLIGPTGTAKGAMIISEVMWGIDKQGSDDVQWIEFYYTAGPDIPDNQTWQIDTNKPGGGRPTDDVTDRLSNAPSGELKEWKLPGQSPGLGHSTLTSMRRAIDPELYALDVIPVVDIPAGDILGGWEQTPTHTNSAGKSGIVGTPGASGDSRGGRTELGREVVFNEIANREDATFDWIELYNPNSVAATIGTEWVLSTVTIVDGSQKETTLFQFEKAIEVPAGEFLLIVNEVPQDTALATGELVKIPQSSPQGLPTPIYDNDGLDIPEKDYLLILRKEANLESSEQIVDIGGNLGGLVALPHPMWPLSNDWEPIKEDDLYEDEKKTWVRDKSKLLKDVDAWKLEGGETGLGIDRSPDSDNGPTSGTPGFDNDAVKNKVGDLESKNPVRISEIMFGRGDNQLPQWIELFNPSKVKAVNLEKWNLEVQNRIDDDERLDIAFSYTLSLPATLILPNQTVLIVSRSRSGQKISERKHFPDSRTIKIWESEQEPRTLAEEVRMRDPDDPILSSIGFYIVLSDPDENVVDRAGNLDSESRGRDAPLWPLPGGNLEDGGGRASMIRRSDKGTFRDGTKKNGWISADKAGFGDKSDLDYRNPEKGELYYGDRDDIGTPGYRGGGLLPVQLSSFHSKRNDAGAVIITWATESELDNAGFNLLRSSSRSGEFTKINAQLIPGAGTTGEKHTYTWTDTSAKPNVVYYYQIEDVSLDGAHQTLRTTRLRGHVGAHGKLTTTWGVLKSRD